MFFKKIGKTKYFLLAKYVYSPYNQHIFKYVNESSSKVFSYVGDRETVMEGGNPTITRWSFF